MSKVMGIYVKACFNMTTHQIWSNHVTQVANVENFENLVTKRIPLIQEKAQDEMMSFSLIQFCLPNT